MHHWNEVFERHKSDKSAHNYGPAYQFLLKEWQFKTFKMLEIGIWEGASLRAWEEIFPLASIIGVDIMPNAARYVSELNRTVIEIGDASSKEMLDKLASYAPYDLIIDDGSHQPRDVRAVMEGLWKNLSVGGVYILEDLDVMHRTDYDNRNAIMPEILHQLRNETIPNGLGDRITVVAGELVAFVKVR